MDHLNDLIQERVKVVEQARSILNKAIDAKRGMNDDEQNEHDRLYAEAERLQKTIDAGKRYKEERRKEAEEELRRKDAEKETAKGDKKPDAMDGFRSFLKTGRIIGAGSDEFRALQADSDPAGGYIVTPQQFVADLIKAVDDLTYIRSLATVVPVVGSDSLGIPSLDADPDDADWTTELQTGSEDSTMSFGKRELKPYPLAKRIKVSKKLLMKSAVPAEQLVRDRLAYKFAITEEKGFLTGSGSGQALGVFTSSSDGISTSRDVSTDNTTTEVTSDGLINAQMSLKAAYRNRADWIFHRDGIKQIRKLKDGEGRYIWQPSLTADEPDTLLGRPLHESEYAPNTFTTGQYVGIFGDFSYYWVADSMAMELQRLEELYAESNQVGFIARMELDGMPVLGEAFARVKLA